MKEESEKVILVTDIKEPERWWHKLGFARKGMKYTLSFDVKGHGDISNVKLIPHDKK